MAAVFVVAMAAPAGITNALVQNVTPVPVRGMSAGLKTFTMSLIGYGVGGMATGYLSDVFTVDGRDGLGHALLAMSLTLPIAALLFWVSGIWLSADIERAVKLSQADTQTENQV